MGDRGRESRWSSRERGGHSGAWYALLLIPLVGVLIPPLYNVEDPELIGLPFFYWYQLLWVPISAAVTYVVYRKTRGDGA